MLDFTLFARISWSLIYFGADNFTKAFISRFFILILDTVDLPRLSLQAKVYKKKEIKENIFKSTELNNKEELKKSVLIMTVNNQ